jgi:hypothetical protein
VSIVRKQIGMRITVTSGDHSGLAPCIAFRVWSGDVRVVVDRIEHDWEDHDSSRHEMDDALFHGGPPAPSQLAKHGEAQAWPHPRRGEGEKVEELHDVQSRTVLRAIACREKPQRVSMR